MRKLDGFLAVLKDAAVTSSFLILLLAMIIAWEADRGTTGTIWIRACKELMLRCGSLEPYVLNETERVILILLGYAIPAASLWLVFGFFISESPL